MDKKKVIELIKQTISELSATGMGIICTQSTLEAALEELQKPDWISVKDGLPPYGEGVWCANSRFPSAVWKSYRIKEEDNDEFTTDNSDFVRDYQGGHSMTYYHDIVTHWRKIDKLEV